MNGTPCTTQTAQFGCASVPGRVTGVFVALIVIALAVAIFSLVCQVKIISKAGYSGWYVLTGFVPILGFVMFLIFAFGKWPIQERLEAAERGAGRRHLLQLVRHGASGQCAGDSLLRVNGATRGLLHELRYAPRRRIELRLMWHAIVNGLPLEVSARVPGGVSGGSHDTPLS